MRLTWHQKHKPGHKLCANTLWYSLQIHKLFVYTHAGTHNAMLLMSYIPAAA